MPGLEIQILEWRGVKLDTMRTRQGKTELPSVAAAQQSAGMVSSRLPKGQRRQERPGSSGQTAAWKGLTQSRD